MKRSTYIWSITALTIFWLPAAGGRGRDASAFPSDPSIKQSGRDSKLAAAGFSGLPVEAQSTISTVLGRDLPGYQAWAQGSGFTLQNARHKLAAGFTPAGVELRSGKALWKFELRSYGYGNALQPVPAAVPRASSNRVEYRRGVLTEWYVNGPLGLEQGFTLMERPRRPIRATVGSPGLRKMAVDGRQWTIDNSRGQPLTIALALSGNLTASVDQGTTSLTLSRSGGRSELRYTGLTAYDSTGKKLWAWLEAQGEQLLLKVEDATARYPVVIDPWVQLAKLTASDGGPMAASVAVDGDTVVAGVGNTAYGGPGVAAYVFVKPPTGWANMTQTAKLTASDGAGFNSVAISGNTIVAVTFFSSAAYLFVKPDSGWTTMTETAKLNASDPEGPAYIGFSVAVSGNTVVAGGPNATNGAGAAYVWVKPSSGWASMGQTARLTASDGGCNPYCTNLGYSVSISGNTVVAGTPGATFNGNNYQGAVYLFVEPSSGWTNMTQTARLTASDGAAGNNLGSSVAIDGNTVVAGPYAIRVPAYVFVKPAAGWADVTETAKLTASDEATVQSVTNSVAVSGNTVVVGRIPAAYVYVEPASGWANMTETDRVISSDAAADDLFGFSAAVNGNTVVVGDPAPRLPDGTPLPGTAYVFGRTGLPSSLNFGTQFINTTSSPKTATLTNIGDTTLDISSIVASGRFSQTNNCGSSLLSGASCNIAVTFRPTTACFLTGTLTVTDASGGAQTVKLSGAGTVMTLSKTSVNFGNQAAGTTSTAQTITLTNHATSQVTIAAVTIAGLNSPSFAQTNTCGTTVAPGASCTLSVTFRPRGTGSKTGTLNVFNSGSGAGLRVTLTGDGT